MRASWLVGLVLAGLLGLGAPPPAAIAFPLPLVHADVHFTPCPDAPTSDGCAHTLAPLPTPVYINPYGVDPLAALRHELGHVADAAWLTDADRAAITVALGLAGRDWRSPPNSPHERFAEAFGHCVRYGRRLGRRELRLARRNLGYDYWPTRARHGAICRVTAAAAARPFSAR